MDCGKKVLKVFEPWHVLPDGTYKLISHFTSDWWHDVTVEVYTEDSPNSPPGNKAWRRIRPKEPVNYPKWPTPYDLDGFRSWTLARFISLQ